MQPSTPEQRKGWAAEHVKCPCLAIEGDHCSAGSDDWPCPVVILLGDVDMFERACVGAVDLIELEHEYSAQRTLEDTLAMFRGVA